MFINYIAQEEKQKPHNDISKSFISVISDGSTDNSSIEKEIFFVGYVINGDINVKYIASLHRLLIDLVVYLWKKLNQNGHL